MSASASPGAIVRRGGISRIVFVISLIIVGAGSGVTGYYIGGLGKPLASTVTLNGAGSTFVYPLISAMNTNYTKTNPNILINYQPVGSGTGINDLSSKTVDFGASDAPLTNAQILAAPNTVTIPDTIGAVVIAYNIPINSTYSIHSGLNLNVTVAAEIFNGMITVWNDSRIQALNPNLPTGVVLPNKPITIVHRSDSSGTTFVFSGYLNSSSAWGLGQGKTISWPSASIGANGNQGVASVIQGTKYTVGYVELAYALSASPALSYASLKNPAGQFIAPSLASSLAAASSAPSLPAGDNAAAWQPINLLNSADPAAYPIVTFSYIMVYKELNVYGSSMTQSRAQDLVNYLWFIVHAGQDQATPLNYVPLPSNVVQNAEASLRLITYNGQQLHA
ncbi:phosphate ABC transporter substrate-binding protein PstS [Candidatus Bathyarchaeota archaeon]|nr:phosphate ABC transporter substrate-binding protein PstS [Candidatus Bathyarchaeota archaeon]